MAKQQYRVGGRLSWQSNSGNALLAVVNKIGSGKRYTVRSVEVNPMSVNTALALVGMVTVARATVAGGESVTPVALDTNATWPSTVSVLAEATTTSVSKIVRTVTPKQLTPGGVAWFNRLTPVGAIGMIVGTLGKDSTSERLTVRQGESIAVYTETLAVSMSFRVSATLRVSGTPNRTFTVTYFTNANVIDKAIFALVNGAGSGEVVTLLNFSVEEVGTFETPYFQLVPVGGLIDSAASAPVPIMKMDTAHPDPSSHMEVRSDVPMFPFGMPENAFSDSGLGTPKGFNYLKTKDFLGPLYRSVFPEGMAARLGINDTFVGGAGHRWSDIFGIKSGILIREGEGIALVSAAEGAVSASAVGVSGWLCFEVWMNIDVEPSQIPVISLSGMVEGSRWRIERVSDSALIATGVADVTGATSFDYTNEDTPINLRLRVRKASSAPYYKPYEVQFSLPITGISIPVSQIADP